jgi:hypothetical protein
MSQLWKQRADGLGSVSKHVASSRRDEDALRLGETQLRERMLCVSGETQLRERQFKNRA